MEELQNHVGQVIDRRYRLDKLLGQGGMGTVYLGYHVNLLRPVAVKLLHLSKKMRHEDVLRFHREARAAAAIGHQGIVDVFDVGTTKWGDPYLVMEYLEGRSLETLLQSHAPFDLQAAVEITEQLLLALNAAHEKGIVHRDIKPDNILLVHDQNNSKPTVKLIDFGVSKISSRPGSSSKLTQTGTFIGTPAYAAPEQANCDNTVDHRADLYSVGVVFYEMLTAELPYVGETFNDLVLKIVSQPPRPPHEVNPDFPREAGGFLERSMSKKPKDRFQSATQMLDALRELRSVGSSEQSCSELNALIADKSCAIGDLGPNPKAGFASEPPLPETLDAPNARADSSAANAKRTRRTYVVIAAAASAAILLLALAAMRMQEPTAQPAVKDPVLRGDVAPTPSESTALTQDDAPTPERNTLDGLPMVAGPAPQDTAGSASSVDGEAAQNGSVEQHKPGAKKRAASRIKTAKSKQRAEAKRAKQPEQAKPADKSRFIKGGRHTEIAQEFE